MIPKRQKVKKNATGASVEAFGKGPFKELKLDGVIRRRHVITVIVPALRTPKEVQAIAATIRQTIPDIVHVQVALGTTEENQTLSFWHSNPLRRWLHSLKQKL